MANLQYIGARYVPIVFDNPDDGSAAWKSGVSYENLVIVTYLDDSYTSRKPVPASVGNPADNPDYWAKTGDFNAALTNMQNEINDINDKLTDKTEFVVFGDSWAANSVYCGGEYLIAAFGRKFPDCTVHDYAVNGARFQGSNGYIAQITDMTSDITLDTSKIKAVILVGGVGDYRNGYTYAQLSSDLQIWYDTLVSTLGYKPVVYFFPDYSIENDLNMANDTRYGAQEAFWKHVLDDCAREIRICYTFGWVWTWNTGNYFHPNASGYQTFYENCCSVINGEPPRKFRYDSIEGTIDNNDIPTEAGKKVKIDFYLVDGGMLVNISGSAAAILGSNTKTITFDREAPVPLKSKIYLGDGLCLMYYSGSWQFAAANPTAVTSAGWLVTYSGELEVQFIVTDFGL